jgi:hypothetical protein
MPEMSRQEMEALIAKLTAENTGLKQTAMSRVQLRVGQAGTVCLYHGSKYPIALYRSQWETILPFIRSGAVEQFIEAHAHELATKQ